MASPNKNALADKKILLGISGGIAAYKTPELIRRLKEQGAIVRVVLTKAAQSFVTPLSLQAVSGLAIHDDLLDPSAEAAMGHIELARWADLILIAPATANLIAKINGGFADDLLSTLIVATNKPLALAPAMNQVMWQNAATQRNAQSLSDRGILLWGPASGEQACGEFGPGRMLEPNTIVTRVIEHFLQSANARTGPPSCNTSLKGKKVLITAGPTREALDPVRYISNHSSGKMGFAVAAAAQNAGAETILIAGPVSLSTPAGVSRVDVVSAQDMFEAVETHQNSVDIFIATAAVADYRAADSKPQKIKKHNDSMQIELIKNPDILATVARWPNKPYCVGFAAETQDVEHYAKDKIQRKKLDMIAANDVSQSGIGFNSDENALSVFWPQGGKLLARASKDIIAQQLIQLIGEKYSGR